MRLVIAATFLVAAYYKIPFWSGPMEGMSEGMRYLTLLLSIVEPLGALALIVGFLTRYAAWGLSIIMAGAVIMTAVVMKIGFITQTGAGWNFPLLVLAGCLILATFGAGGWSLDAVRKRIV